MDLPGVPESCTRCPHLDEFHSTCTHPVRQSIVQELSFDGGTCPVFGDVRADSMRQLEDQLG